MYTFALHHHWNEMARVVFIFEKIELKFIIICKHIETHTHFRIQNSKCRKSRAKSTARLLITFLVICFVNRIWFYATYIVMWSEKVLDLVRYFLLLLCVCLCFSFFFPNIVVEIIIYVHASLIIRHLKWDFFISSFFLYISFLFSCLNGLFLFVCIYLCICIWFLVHVLCIDSDQYIILFSIDLKYYEKWFHTIIIIFAPRVRVHVKMWIVKFQITSLNCHQQQKVIENFETKNKREREKGKEEERQKRLQKRKLNNDYF